MRRFAFVVGAILLAACGDKPKTPPPPAAGGTMVNLADLAGEWTMQTMGTTSDSVLLTYTMQAKSDTAGWTLTFGGRPPMPIHVMASGDSLTMDAAPYESMLRPGVQVSTHSVSRIVDGKLVGNTVAHYSNTPTADSVRMLRTSATRAPK